MVPVFNPANVILLKALDSESAKAEQVSLVTEFLLNFKQFALTNSNARLAIDLETTGLDPYQGEITVIGMSYDGERVMLAHPKQVPVELFNAIMLDAELAKVMHNAKFDMKWLINKIGSEFANVDDTYIMRKLITAGLDTPANLAHCAVTYLNYDMSKEQRANFIGNTVITDEMALYAAIDVVVTWLIQPILIRRIHEEQLELVYQHIEKDLVQVVAEMELTGINIDKEYLVKLEEACLTKRNHFQSKLDGQLNVLKIMPTKTRKALVREKIAMGVDKAMDLLIEEPVPTFNVKSSKQVVDVLNALGFTVKSSSAEVLDDLPYTDVSLAIAKKRFGIANASNDDYLKIAYEIVEMILDIRAVRHALENFIEGLKTDTNTELGKDRYGFVNKVTGKVHGDFNQLGTDTGRFSHSKPNLGQQPGDEKSLDKLGMVFRNLYVPPEGHCFVTYDYSACEIRILAEMCQDANLMAACNSGADIHMANACYMFNVTLDKVTKDMRKRAKTGIFATNYGAGANKIASQLRVSKEQGQAVKDAVANGFPGIARWGNGVKQVATNEGYVLTLSGRKRYFDVPEKPAYSSMETYSDAIRKYNWAKAAIERRAQNGAIQGSNADITKLAMVWLRPLLKQYNAKLILTVHDELVAVCPIENGPAVSEIMCKTMLEAEQEFLTRVDSKVEGGHGPKWGH